MHGAEAVAVGRGLPTAATTPAGPPAFQTCCGPSGMHHRHRHKVKPKSMYHLPPPINLLFWGGYKSLP